MESEISTGTPRQSKKRTNLLLNVDPGGTRAKTRDSPVLRFERKPVSVKTGFPGSGKTGFSVFQHKLV